MAARAFRVLSISWSLLAAAALLAGASLAALAQHSGSAENTPAPRLGAAPQRSVPAPSSGSSGPAKPTDRLREGTRLTEELGVFQSSGDRVAFLPGGNSKDSYRVLENLALQRVSVALDEGRGQGQWVVSGVITEFRGANYLLITKAVLPLQEQNSETGR